MLFVGLELTREVGHKASEQVMDLKRLCDLKVSKTGDLMTGNLILSADGGNDRLFDSTVQICHTVTRSHLSLVTR